MKKPIEVGTNKPTTEPKPLLCICNHPTEHHEIGVMRDACRVFDCSCVYFREKREADCER